MPLIVWGIIGIGALAAGGYLANGVAQAEQNSSDALDSLVEAAVVIGLLYAGGKLAKVW